MGAPAISRLKVVNVCYDGHADLCIKKFLMLLWHVGFSVLFPRVNLLALLADAPASGGGISIGCM